MNTLGTLASVCLIEGSAENSFVLQQIWEENIGTQAVGILLMEGVDLIWGLFNIGFTVCGYTCLLTCIMLKSHACRLKTWITHIQDSFSCLTQNSGRLNNNNLFLIRRKLTSEYDQMRLTTITTCNNYNKIYLKNT